MVRELLAQIEYEEKENDSFKSSFGIHLQDILVI
jgi:hypothetical protein